ncbi:unnamed protein product (macronuclear) [Paramecium tetraurelia]|uniref:Glycosyl hydrolase family 13 catalytic domain-containing protein n=1 Tax=Paramecium tetraurelia TaxID=5888 RepID=A0DD72_PARTE|nr:uncharacterized protein GSPATT00015848001 [Paramecium tetraurelia]CAK80989.1 unnamed protein product [Paramecium tetraurelia]|eukprot:XP_001448386.1 hypothetical protein (macronuclear) [Paramecium tetraurelia strain d4-2]
MKQLIQVLSAVLITVGMLYQFSPQPNKEQNLRDWCTNFDGDNGCKGSQTDNPSDWLNRNFQTPQKGDSLWREGYQDYHILQGYAQQKYSSDLRSCSISIYTRVNPEYQGSLVYSFDGEEQTSPNKTFSAPRSEVQIKVYLRAGGEITIAKLDLQPVDFVWNHPTVNQSSHYKNGQKGAIVELFGWKYEDIELECEMIAKAGYMGVKVFPPQESILDYEHPENGELNPWYWLYQPVSYRLNSRMGTVEELRKMINTCQIKGIESIRRCCCQSHEWQWQ